ncbi:MAG: hypothetical protein DI536_35185 [Archangium gephyra]|uniref:Uncharacterized protein n=1 Tax=Archangium gephyra TaxID=48 RepID=A0A2W5SWG6_9BACT|nr:MAG: hypothetical protein DI536_35185 [Archangium gephyra]
MITTRLDPESNARVTGDFFDGGLRLRAHRAQLVDLRRVLELAPASGHRFVFPAELEPPLPRQRALHPLDAVTVGNANAQTPRVFLQ